MTSQAVQVIGGFLCAGAVLGFSISQLVIQETDDFRFLRVGYITFLLLDLPMALIHWLAADCGTLSVGGSDLGPPSMAKNAAYFFARMEGHERAVGDFLALFLTFNFPPVTIYLMLFKIMETCLCFLTLVWYPGSELKNKKQTTKAPTRFKVFIRLVLLLVPIGLEYCTSGAIF